MILKMVNMKTNKIVVFIIMCCGINHFTFSQEKAEEILTKKVEKEILELMDEGNIPGLVLVTIKNGHQTINNFGYSNLDDKKPVTSNTLFELGSCSKAFTAL